MALSRSPLKVTALIPARYGATRFPAKLVQDLGGAPVIVRTYQAVAATGLFDSVHVVTDSEAIAEPVRVAGGSVLFSQGVHETGSDRIAEAVEDLDVDVAVNVQGDEPFIDARALGDLIDVFRQDPEGRVDLASLMVALEDAKAIVDPNVVKVITDREGLALYFSRAPIPFAREGGAPARYFRHLGVYAFRKRALLDFRQLPMGPLEASEKIEAIRFLEHGRRIRMVATESVGIGIDTPEDLAKANAIWK